MLAAGVGFYSMLAVVPSLAATVSLYALIADPADVKSQFDSLARIIPPDAANILSEQLAALAARENEGLGVGLLLGVLVAAWSAHRGTDALVRAITTIYGDEETRGFVQMNVFTMGLTLAAIILLVFALSLIVALPAINELFDLPVFLHGILQGLGWPIMAALVMFSLAVVYRYAPPRRDPKWRWVSYGSILATLLWLTGSVGFSAYVSSFGKYNETYGSLGAIIVLLMWFYLTAYVILIGAALNAEMEHQTAMDSTVGPDRPRGKRGAHVADHLGPEP